MTNLFLNRYKKWTNQEINPEEIQAKHAIRVNTLKISNDALYKRMSKKKVKLEKIPYLENGYYYASEFSIGSTPEYLLGYYYPQDPASQVPVQILDPKPGDIVLDMAAAPGGKTTQMSAKMQNKGIIIALDIKRDRIQSLNNNIERTGCKNILVYNKDAIYAGDLGITFDKILLDAPCSGNFCIDQEWFSKRNLNDFKDKANIQIKMLKEAYNILKPGGIIVYSTCSLEIEEDEEVIEWAIDNLDVELMDIGLDIGDHGLTDKTKKTRRFWPNKTGTQGFFIAKLKKIR